MPSEDFDPLSPSLCELNWTQQYRIISAGLRPIGFFESLVEPDLMEELLHIEGLTNDRVRVAVGEISLVGPEDRISGPGSSPVMAAFTHVGVESRFSDGSFGVYYAARTLRTAIEETKYHRARFLAYTAEDAGEIDMRVYVGKVSKPLHDIRGSEYNHLHAPSDWQPSQAFGLGMRATRSWGLVYRSVRDPGGECVAALRPPAVSIPRQGALLSYLWDGTRIVQVYEKTAIP